MCRTWLDGDLGDCVPPARKVHLVECLPLAELRRFGWSVSPGPNFALISPLGGLAVSKPADGRWLFFPNTRLRRPRLWLAVTGYIGFNGIAVIPRNRSAVAPLLSLAHCVP